VTAAKSALGMKNLNVAAALAGHKMLSAAAAKNPKMPFNQLLNKVPANARQHYMNLTSSIPSNMLDPSLPAGQFRSTVQKLKQATGIMKSLNNSTELEFTDKEQMTEALRDEIQPSPMLVLRRKGIRIFPDGRRVALYTNDKYGLVFTIPYNAGGTGTAGSFGSQNVPSVIQAESVEPICETLEQVAKFAQQDNVTSTAKQFKFADGSKLKVSHGAAKAIHMVHGALNDENKKKFADMLNTPKGFEKAAHFALSKVNFTIGGK
jgi:hypothetical protein